MNSNGCVSILFSPKGKQNTEDNETEGTIGLKEMEAANESDDEQSAEEEEEELEDDDGDEWIN